MSERRRQIVYFPFSIWKVCGIDAEAKRKSWELALDSIIHSDTMDRDREFLRAWGGEEPSPTWYSGRHWSIYLRFSYLHFAFRNLIGISHCNVYTRQQPPPPPEL